MDVGVILQPASHALGVLPRYRHNAATPTLGAAFPQFMGKRNVGVLPTLGNHGMDLRNGRASY